MSNKIQGLKYLEERNYSNIVIDQKGGKYKVYIFPSKLYTNRVKSELDNKVFTKKMTIENVELVMKKFYEQNSIMELGKIFINYDETRFKFLKCVNTDLKMFIRVYDDKLKDILKEGYNNYINTRDELLCTDDNKIYELNIDSDNSCFDIFDLDVTKVTLNPNCEDDRKFFKKMLDYKLKNEGEEAFFGYSEEDNEKKHYYVKCGEFELYTDYASVYPYMQECVNEYNSERIKQVSKCKKLMK